MDRLPPCTGPQRPRVFYPALSELRANSPTVWPCRLARTPFAAALELFEGRRAWPFQQLPSEPRRAQLARLWATIAAEE